MPAGLCDDLGLADDDWVELTSHHGAIRVPVRRMAGVNASTVWTWNAIGKRAGAWGLDADAPESRQGFLLNHLIDELLPPRGDGLRWSNSDPVTGQAAWFDLRVRLEKVDPPPDHAARPKFDAQKAPPGQQRHPAELRYGQDWADRRKAGK